MCLILSNIHFYIFTSLFYRKYFPINKASYVSLTLYLSPIRNITIFKVFNDKSFSVEAISALPASMPTFPMGG